MASGSGPKSGQARELRRRRRFKPYLVLEISALICVPLLLAVPLARHFGWGAKTRTEIHQESSKVFDLVLTEARLDGEGPERTVRGILLNRSGSRYEDVQVSFNLRNRDGASLGTAVANLPAMGPNGTAPFQTAPVPPDVFRATLREVVGTRR